MLAFDAAMVDLTDKEVQLWEPLTGLSVELEEAISRYDVQETRTLLHLTRDLAVHPPQPSTLEVREFSISDDGDAWIAVNNLAFANHKEQGSWTTLTLAERTCQVWFDPSLFLLAGRGSITAWCWCKIDPSRGRDRGEIYVIGTSPEAQGQGLGGAMLEIGCDKLRKAGVSAVDLFVDGDNAAALSMYARAQFTETSRRRSWLFR